MHLAKSTIKGEEKKWTELSKEREDLEAEVKKKLHILAKNIEKRKQSRCINHQLVGKDLETALAKLNNPEVNKSKSNLTLLKILKNLCFQCLHVKDARYDVDDQKNLKTKKTAQTKMRPIKPKGSETTHQTLYEYGLLVKPSEMTEISKKGTDTATVMGKNQIPSNADITIANTPSNSAPFTNIKINKSSLANKNLIFGNHATQSNLMPSSLSNVTADSVGKITTPYPVINVDAALNQVNENYNSKYVATEERSEEREKFKDILFYDQAEAGINIDDVL